MGTGEQSGKPDEMLGGRVNGLTSDGVAILVAS